MEKSYRQQVWDLRKEIEDSIANIVSNKGNNINIPFYYDEDKIDDDIKTLIEDGYDVRAENGVNILRLSIIADIFSRLMLLQFVVTAVERLS